MQTGNNGNGHNPRLVVVHPDNSPEVSALEGRAVPSGNTPDRPIATPKREWRGPYHFAVIVFLSVVVLCLLIVIGLIIQGGASVLLGLTKIVWLLAIGAAVALIIFIGRKKRGRGGIAWIDRWIRILEAIRDSGNSKNSTE